MRGRRLGDGRALLLLAGVIFVAALFAGCGDSGAPGTTPTGGPESRTPSPVVATATAAGATPTAPAAATATPAPPPTATPSGGPASVLYRGDPLRRVVALTFDAGSDAGYTFDILRTLNEQGVRASFGITGLWAEANRDALLAISAAGHELINHTYSHRSFTGRSTQMAPLTFEERSLELSRAETTVYRLTSRSTVPYFRPPFGDIDDSVIRDAGALGYGTIVMWTIDTLGWNHATRDQIVQRTMDLAAPGAIVIMHVGSESQDALALEEMIQRLRGDGYGFVTISQLISG